MTRHMLTRTVPAHEDTILSRVTCDLCGREHRMCGGGEDEWGAGPYDVDHVVITYETGTKYPDCGSTTETKLHVCPRCFTEKVLPWFVAQKAEPTVTEKEWG